VLVVALGVSVRVAGFFALVAVRPRPQQTQLIRASGIPVSVSHPEATLMGLSPSRPSRHHTSR
jgi:hypothetical protein